MASFLDSVKNFAYEASGAGDIMRGAREIQKGNIVGGLGRIGLGAVGFVPVAGWAARGATTAARVAKGSKVVQAANKTRPVTTITKSKPVQSVVKSKPVVKVTKPVKAGTAKANTTLQKASQQAQRGLIPAKSKVGKFVSMATTSPYAISRIVSSRTIPQTRTPVTQPNEVPMYQRPFGGQDVGGPFPFVGGGGDSGGGGSGGGGGGGGGGGKKPPKDQTPPGSEGPGDGEGTTPGGDSGTGTNNGVGTDGGYIQYTEPGGAMFSPGSGGIMTGQSGQSKQGGLIGGAQVAGMNYKAGLAQAAAEANIRDAALREMLSQRIMGVQGGAADIIGGRSQAILGQGITGARRDYTVGQAQEAQQALGQQAALRRAYGSELSEAYNRQAERVLEGARARSEAAAQIRQLGIA